MPRRRRADAEATATPAAQEEAPAATTRARRGGRQAGDQSGDTRGTARATARRSRRLAPDAMVTIAVRGEAATAMRALAAQHSMPLVRLLRDMLAVYQGQVAAGYVPGALGQQQG